MDRNAPGVLAYCIRWARLGCSELWYLIANDAEEHWTLLGTFDCFRDCLCMANLGCLVRWDQGLLDMCIGEKRTLTIPPEYGYGNRGVGPIPAGSTLVFETELVAIEGVDKDEL